MSKLETVIVSSESLKRTSQDYEKLVVWYNLYKEEGFPSEVYQKEGYDVFGFIPNGFHFYSSESLSKIMNAFNTDPTQIALLIPDLTVNNKMPYFLNKKILPLMTIVNINSLFETLEELGLRAVRIKEPLFIYE